MGTTYSVEAAALDQLHRRTLPKCDPMHMPLPCFSEGDQVLMRWRTASGHMRFVPVAIGSLCADGGMVVYEGGPLGKKPGTDTTLSVHI